MASYVKQKRRPHFHVSVDRRRDTCHAVDYQRDDVTNWVTGHVIFVRDVNLVLAGMKNMWTVSIPCVLAKHNNELRKVD